MFLGVLCYFIAIKVIKKRYKNKDYISGTLFVLTVECTCGRTEILN